MSKKSVNSASYCSSEAYDQVTNHKLLKAFCERRKKWFSWHEVDMEEPNSIQKQLMNMLTTDMQYRVFRAESEKHKTGDGIAIPLIMYLANVGYVYSQIFAIRRLVDNRKDVLSLIRLLSELDKYRHLITRENFVSYDGTPYDPSSWAQNASPDLNFQYQMFGLDAPGLSAYGRSADRHARFDGLSGVSVNRRERSDLIRPQILEKIQRWIDDSGASNFVTTSHKYLAHAAEASTISTPIAEIDLGETERVQRALVRTARAIFSIILCSDTWNEPVPMIPLGFFGTVWAENAFVPSTTRMQKHWDDLKIDRNAWARGIEEELISI